MQDESLFLIQYDHLVPHAISDDWLMEPNQSMLRQLIYIELPFVSSYYTWCFLIAELVVIIKLGLEMRPSSLIMELFMVDSRWFFFLSNK